MMNTTRMEQALRSIKERGDALNRRGEVADAEDFWDAFNEASLALSAPAQGEAVALWPIEQDALDRIEASFGSENVPLDDVVLVCAALGRLAALSAPAQGEAVAWAAEGEIEAARRLLGRGGDGQLTAQVRGPEPGYVSLYTAPPAPSAADAHWNACAAELDAAGDRGLNPPTEDKGGAWPDDATLARAGAAYTAAVNNYGTKLRKESAHEVGIRAALTAAAPPALTQPVVDDAMIDRAMDADAEEYGASIPHSRVRRLLVAALTQPAPSSGEETT